MIKNNKGISLIIVLLFLFLVSGGIAGYLYYFKNINISNLIISKPDSEIVESDKNKPYYSVGFIRYKLPELKPEILDKYFNDLNTNDESKNCYEKKYFQNRGIRNDSYNNSNIAILEFGRPIGEPICKGAPGPYAEISLATAFEDTSEDYDNKDFYNFVKTDLNSSKDITVYENKSDYESIGKVYFLIQDNNNLKNKLIISITPAVSDKDIHYIYVKEVIKTMDILKISQFKGIDNCPKNECRDMEIINKSSNPIIITDIDTGSIYSINLEKDTKIDRTSSNKSNLYVLTYNESNNFKVSEINIKSGEIKDIILVQKGISIQSIFATEDKIFFITGNSCGDTGPCKNYTKKLYSFDLNTKKLENLNDKSFSDLGVINTNAGRDLEMGIASIYKVDNNKLLISYGQVIQVEEVLFYYDLVTKTVSNIEDGKIFYGEELLIKRKELGIYSQINDKLFIRNGEITREN